MSKNTDAINTLYKLDHNNSTIQTRLRSATKLVQKKREISLSSHIPHYTLGAAGLYHVDDDDPASYTHTR
jgi:hypothetical protein